MRRLNEADADAIGFVYYSVHWAAEKVTNVNYLITVNAKQPDAFWDDSLKLDDVQHSIRSGHGEARA